jgi:hypothetical protein
MTTATEHLGTPSPLFSARSRWITDWRPEDETFWDAAGTQVARHNLIFSMLAGHIGFLVWSIWSVVSDGGDAAGADAWARARSGRSVECWSTWRSGSHS